MVAPLRLRQAGSRAGSVRSEIVSILKASTGCVLFWLNSNIRDIPDEGASTPKPGHQPNILATIYETE